MKIFNLLVSPKSTNDDLARKEFILNILLASSLVLFFAAFSINIITLLFGRVPSVPAGIFFGLFLFSGLLLFLSKKGFFHFVSYCLLAVFFVMAILMLRGWGVELPSGLLVCILLIIMSGILISTRFAFALTAILGLVIFSLGYFQIEKIYSPNLYWKTESVRLGDLIMFVIIFFIIMAITWLSNREIEKSLARARKSEAELKKERDSLEVTVEEKTKELKEAQLEKMTQLYRFAEFGRLSTGIFHDLLSPLTAVSLNMQKVISQHGKLEVFDETRTCLDRAFTATKKMEDFVLSVRRQMSMQENKIMFSLNTEIQQVMDVLSHKAMQWQTKLSFYPVANNENIEIFGNSTKFNQVVLNLVANAIESYSFPADGDKERPVEIYISNEKELVKLIVKDYGVGVPKENFDKIFQPFFTTKMALGMGIGLSTVKRIIEKDFNGIIMLESKENKGTTFTIKFPRVVQ